MCITISALSMFYFFERHGDILRNIAYKQITTCTCTLTKIINNTKQVHVVSCGQTPPL